MPTKLQHATAEIARRDKVMAGLIERLGPPTLRSRRQPDAFGALVRAIAHQQLAGAAASAIHGRFRALFDENLTPEAVLAIPERRIRDAGMSGAKAISIKDLAAKVTDGTVPLHRLSRLPDDEIIARLSQVRGIGRWTAEMFLIFQLGRLDVWPVDDLGVRKGYAIAYRLPELPSPKELNVLGERFTPYRTVVAWYCWRAYVP
jgi:3-methyladenine DNA glycosylase/8-oxoguanine DNA glycosylase